MRRRAAVLAAVAALAALLLLLLPGAPADRPPSRPAERGAEDRSPAPPPLPPDPEAAEAPPPADRPAPAAPATPEPEPVPLLVEVLKAGGSRAYRSRVYALDAGSPGGGANVRADARVDREGRATLVLPADGLYDVGVVVSGQFGTLLLPDVIAPREGVLRITAPRSSEVRIRAAPELEMSVPLVLSVFVAPRSDARGVTPPGRDEVLGTVSVIELGPRERETAITVTEGTLYRIRATGAIANPDPFSPPGTVVLHPAPVYRVRVVLEPGDGGKPDLRHVSYQLRDDPPLVLGVRPENGALLTVPVADGRLEAFAEERDGTRWFGHRDFENLHPERENLLIVPLRKVE